MKCSTSLDNRLELVSDQDITSNKQLVLACNFYGGQVKHVGRLDYILYEDYSLLNRSYMEVYLNGKLRRLINPEFLSGAILPVLECLPERHYYPGGLVFLPGCPDQVVSCPYTNQKAFNIWSGWGVSYER